MIGICHRMITYCVYGLFHRTGTRRRNIIFTQYVRQQRAMTTSFSLFARFKKAFLLATPMVGVISLAILFKNRAKPITQEPDDTILPEYSDMLGDLARRKQNSFNSVELKQIMKSLNSFTTTLDAQIDYGDLSHQIRNLDFYIKNPSIAFITEQQLALAINRQANLLAYCKADQGYRTQITLPTHPHSYLIQHLVELWFVLPKSETPTRIDFGTPNPEKKKVVISKIDPNNRITSTKQIPAGPYFFQPIPYMNAANLIKLASYEGKGESEIDELLQDWSEELSSYPYGNLYSLHHLISGTIEKKHVYGLTYGSTVAEAAKKFSGVLLDPKFTESKRDKWFNLFLAGKFGGKTDDWYEAMASLYLKDNTPASWKERIKSTILKEESWITPLSPAAKRAISKMD